MAFKISSISSQAEYDAHALEVVYSHLKLRQLQQAVNGQIGMSDGSMSQSMMGGALGVQGRVLDEIFGNGLVVTNTLGW